MTITTDDLSWADIQFFSYFDQAKKIRPDLKVIAFTIAKDLPLEEFEKWYEERKDWVEIAVHCYDHDYPQEAWRPDQEHYIQKALEILRPFVPERPLYRPPGFRCLPMTEPILRKLGFRGIAHQNFIKLFDTGEIIPTFDTHCSDKYLNPITEVWNSLP